VTPPDDVIKAQLADGTELQFPPGTPDEVIDRVVQEHVLKPQTSGELLTAPLDVLKGAAKGAGHTAVGLGRAAKSLTRLNGAGFSPLEPQDEEAFKQAEEQTTPKGRWEGVGAGAEQMAEFAVPGAAKYPAALERALALRGLGPLLARMGKSGVEAGAVASAQHGGDSSDPSVKLAAALGAGSELLPLLLRLASQRQSKLASRTLARQFAPKGPVDRADVAGTVVPTLLEEGGYVSGSDLGFAQKLAQKLGKADAARVMEELKIMGDSTDISPVIQRLEQELSKSANVPGTGGKAVTELKPSTILDASGKPHQVPVESITKPVEANGAYAGQLQERLKVLEALKNDAGGPQVGNEAVIGTRRIADQGYSHTKLNPADQSPAESWKHMADGLRREISKANPDMAAANEYFHAMKRANDIYEAKLLGQVGKEPSKTGVVMGLGGASAAAATGSTGVGALAALPVAVIRGLQSTAWRTASAAARKAVADALISGNMQRVTRLITAITLEKSSGSYADRLKVVDAKNEDKE
jgi:hypothetical protein